MEKTLVVYYSNKGNNKFLAEKTAKAINADIVALKPRINSSIIQLMASKWNWNLANKTLKKDLSDYDRIVLFGPIMMGLLLNPLKQFVIKNKASIKELIFGTCCGSSDEEKDKKFGYGLVFNQLEQITNSIPLQCHAFPISLVLSEEKKNNPELIMKTRLNSENFDGSFKERHTGFIAFLQN